MNKVIMFTLGAAAGSLVTWKLVKDKYKKLADEEIEEVREYYKNKQEKCTADLCGVETDVYVEEINNLGYSTTEEDKSGEVYVEPGVERIEPYVISPDEYGEIPGFDTECWTYYADSVLVNENEDIVSNPEHFIGDALSHFGEYEDDSVHVRNENIGIECDYEIIKHMRTFSEIYGSEN